MKAQAKTREAPQDGGTKDPLVSIAEDIKTQLRSLQKGTEGKDKPEDKPEDKRSNQPDWDKRFDEFGKAVTEGFRTITDAVKERDERIDGLEQKITDTGSETRGAKIIPFRKALEGQGVEQDIKEGLRSNRRYNVPSILVHGASGLRADEEIIGSAEVGDWGGVMRRPGFTPYYTEEYGLGEVMMSRAIEMNGETVEDIVEDVLSAYGVIHTQVKGAVAGGTTAVAAIDVDDTTGFAVGANIKVKDTGGTLHTVAITGITDADTLAFATDAINFNIADNAKIICDAAEVTEEEGAKPYTYLQFDKVTETLKVIAVMAALSKKRIATTSQLMSVVREKLPKRVLRALSWHLINGDGTADELDGFGSHSDLTTVTWSTSLTETSANRLDAILAGVDEILTPGVPALVMRKSTWRAILTEKDGNNRYLHSAWGNYLFQDGGPGKRYVGPYPVIIDHVVPASYVYAIDLSHASFLYINPAMSGLALGHVNDDFEKNIIRARYEDLLCHYIATAQGFVKIYLDSAPSS